MSEAATVSSVRYTERTLAVEPNLSLFVRNWTVPNARAQVVLLHGYAEHSGRYTQVAETLVARGFSVTAYDQRGHGQSGGQRGHVARFSAYLTDLDQIVTGAKQTGPATVYLVGHSMGALVALRYLMEHSDRIARFAVSAPFLGVAVKLPAWKTTLGKLVSKYIPALAMTNDIPAEHVSHDPAVVAAYVADPLNHKVATARWYTEAMNAIEEVKAGIGRVTVPGIFLIPLDDHVADQRVSLEVYAKWPAVEGSGKRKVEFPGFYHEIFNELERAKALDALANYLAE